ncbi:hypothetical protein BJY54_001215 [Streptomyces nodosus]|nr:hypothetical protein [Streptomyces nodosus]
MRGTGGARGELPAFGNDPIGPTVVQGAPETPAGSSRYVPDRP